MLFQYVYSMCMFIIFHELNINFFSVPKTVQKYSLQYLSQAFLIPWTWTSLLIPELLIPQIFGHLLYTILSAGFSRSPSARLSNAWLLNAWDNKCWRWQNKEIKG